MRPGCWRIGRPPESIGLSVRPDQRGSKLKGDETTYSADVGIILVSYVYFTMCKTDDVRKKAISPKKLRRIWGIFSDMSFAHRDASVDKTKHQPRYEISRFTFSVLRAILSCARRYAGRLAASRDGGSRPPEGRDPAAGGGHPSKPAPARVGS